MSLQLETLGGLRIERDGVELSALYRRRLACALLIHLGVERTVSRDRLAELLWPGRTHERSRRALAQLLYEMRRELGEGWVDAKGGALVAASQLSCDASSFLDLAANSPDSAIGLYNGPFLDGANLVTSREWEEWVDRMASKLGRRFAVTARLAIESHLKAGRAEAALAAALHWSSVDPTEDEAHHRTIELLSFQGAQAEAMRQVDRYRSILEVEGYEALPATAELIQKLTEGHRITEVDYVLGRPENGRLTSRQSLTVASVEGASQLPAMEPPEPGNSVVSSVPRTRRRIPRAWLLGAVVAAVVVGTVVRVNQNRPGPARIAVAEFENNTGDPDLDSYGRMVMAWITDGLQASGVPDVVPPDHAVEVSRSARALASSDIPRRLAVEAGADIVVHGSYFYADSALVLQAWITDVADQRLLATVPAIRTSAEDGAALQQLRDRVIGFFSLAADERFQAPLEGAPSPPRFSAYSTFDRGYDLYLAGEYEAATPVLVAGFLDDTTFAVPLLYASISASNTGNHTYADSLLRVGERQMDKLTPYYRMWFEYRRAMLDGNRAQALRTVRRLAESAPGSKAVYNHAVEAYENGQYVEALAALNTLNPDQGAMRDWLGYWVTLALLQHQLGDYNAELQTAREAQRRFPNHLQPLEAEARALAALGRLSPNDDLLDRARGIASGSSRWQRFAYEAGLELAAHGYREPAEELWSQTLEGSGLPELGPEPSLADVRTRLALRRWDEAFASLTRLPETVRLGREGIAVSGEVAAARGDSAGVANAIAQLATYRGPFQFGVVAVDQARIAARAGDVSLATSFLSRAFSEGRHRGLWTHRDDALVRISPNVGSVSQP